ncbi:MAG: gamma-glutamyl-gamma-aminobutyrate hydrolase family protein [Lentisphaeria bacterium]|nr:gamma-glutamyl-gamma-aminobutyrate hydrolase family protein [Lentisphaeria bacterium]
MGNVAPHHPVIGVTASSVGAESVSCQETYLRAVRDAGGMPLILAPDSRAGSVRAACGRCDGLLFTGGPDITPARYGALAHPQTRVMAASREEWDLALLEYALGCTRLPVLAICLGIQELNVALGGSLLQHLPDRPGSLEHRAPETGERWHPVRMLPESRLAEVTRQCVLEVNTRHHQAVDRPGQGLRVTALAPDGTVEAVEGLDSRRFVVGIQWHAERITELPPQAAIFRAFVVACGGPMDAGGTGQQ